MRSDESFLKKLDTNLSTGQVKHDNQRGILHRERMQSVPDDWTKPEPSKPSHDEQVEVKRVRQKSFFKKLFIVSCVFAIISFGVFGYSLYNGKARLTGENVDVLIQTKSFADSGEEVTVDVHLVNRNTVPMELAKLVIKYPLGTTRDPNAFKEIVKNIGTIGAGETYIESFTTQLFGEQGTEKQFIADVEYRLGDSNAIFESSGETRLTLRSSIATLLVTADTQILSGQQVPIRLQLSGNTSQGVPNVLVTAQYPDGCNLISAEPAPLFDNNVWYVGNLAAGQETNILLNVICNGNMDSAHTFRFSAGSQDQSNERLIASMYTSASHGVVLGQSFLATNILVNGRPASMVALNQNRPTEIFIEFQNTTNTPINNARITATLSGDAYDTDQVIPIQGFYDTNNHTILWTEQENQMLRSVQPGEKGEVFFSISPKKDLGKSATIDISTSVRGILAGGVERELQNVASASLAVGTYLDIIPKTLYYSGSLKNSGPMPLKAGSETTFTLVWQLSNTTNPATDVVVKTVLPTGVEWKGVSAPQSESSNVAYNTVTREVTWNAGVVPVGNEAKTLSFTVGITPSRTQIGFVPNLSNDIILTGIDSVTKTVLQQSKRPMTTRIPNDTSKIGEDGKVIQ